MKVMAGALLTFALVAGCGGDGSTDSGSGEGDASSVREIVDALEDGGIACTGLEMTKEDLGDATEAGYCPSSGVGPLEILVYADPSDLTPDPGYTVIDEEAGWQIQLLECCVDDAQKQAAEEAAYRIQEAIGGAVNYKL